MNRKRVVTGCFCILFILLLYAVGKRYVFPTVERNVEETVILPGHTRAKPPDIEIHRQKIGKGKEKITYFAAEIRLSDATDLRAAFAQNQYGLNVKDTVSGMAQEHDAVFAVNGDYYGYRTDGIVLRNGVLYRDKPTGRDCLVMYKDGTVRAMREGTVSGEKLVEQGAWNVFSFGPVLVKRGKICSGLDEPYKVDLLNVSISGKQPRTGIGILGKNHLLIVAVDGRSEGYSCGMTFQEFAQLFADYGCKLAYNLDGGGSVTMYQKGRILNRPSLGRERRISDVIYIGKKQKSSRKRRKGR